ncbi:MAG: tyrosine--tRNA ligase [Candidatus Aenigmarchaeota archaeon]|nr:tyrosine--tRNA ligase [Candidatus Aenigmarchaeota archaeon]
MDIEKRLDFVKRNTAEITTEEELRKLLQSKEHPSVYLGTAVTGRPHVGYFVWVLKLADFLKAGFKVKVLLADIHGSLDNTPWDMLENRYQYYKMVITPIFEAIGVDTKKVEFVKGSSFQFKDKYIHDVLKMSTFASVHDCTKASSEVVKQSDNPKLSGLIYPIMQSLDEEHLDVDVQYGGVDQRKILMFARENLPKLGYRQRVEVMTPLIPGLQGGDGKMSSSIKGSKIDLLDSPEDVNKKISAAFCPEGVVEGNGILAFLKYVVMVYKGDQKKEFIVKRPEKFGGDVSFKTYEELEKIFVNKKLHPADLKKALAEEVNKLLEPIRKAAKGKEDLIKKAYPE